MKLFYFLLFLDYFSLGVTFCCILVVFAKGKVQVKNNATGNPTLSPEVSGNKVPDFHAFNWKLCKVFELHRIHKLIEINSLFNSTLIGCA